MEHEQERSTTFFRFEDLRVYHKSLDYVSWIYTQAARNQEDHLRRSFFEKFISTAQSITMNIAEGSSRNKSQFIYYLKMAKSSVRECVVISTVGQSRNILLPDEYDWSKNQLMEMTKMIGALIGSLQRSVKEGESEVEDDFD